MPGQGALNTMHPREHAGRIGGHRGPTTYKHARHSKGERSSLLKWTIDLESSMDDELGPAIVDLNENPVQHTSLFWQKQMRDDLRRFSAHLGKPREHAVLSP